MWNNSTYTITSTDENYDYPKLEVHMDKDLISISQMDDGLVDIVVMTMEQAMKLKHALEQYLQGK